MKASRLRATRLALFPLISILLRACSLNLPATLTPTVLGCADISDKAKKYINWTRVPEVNVRIRHDEFSPMIIRLRQGWPYIMRIRNRDNENHIFKAYEFFSKTAVIQASIDGEVFSDNCFGTIVLPPRKTVELRLVAMEDGYFEFEDSWMFIPNTLHLETLYVSADLVDELRQNPRCQIDVNPIDLTFENGQLQLYGSN